MLHSIFNNLRFCVACIYVLFINNETQNEKIDVSQKNFNGAGELLAEVPLKMEFNREIEELLHEIRSLENKMDTIEWKIDPRSDPSFFIDPNNDHLGTESKDTGIETEPVRERKGDHRRQNKKYWNDGSGNVDGRPGTEADAR